MHVLGFMTGTSLDAVDMAVLETDGEAILGFGPAGEVKLDPQTRAVLEAANDAAKSWAWDAAPPEVFARAGRAVAVAHFDAFRQFWPAYEATYPGLSLVGVHGQTVLHQPPNADRRIGRTVQLIDAAWLAQQIGLPVAFDFRTADVAAGGQGAPLAPIYHAALVHWSKLELPVAVLNLGGVGNVTLVGPDGALQAFDTGPANGMIDLCVQARAGVRFDADGALARAGRVDATILSAYLAHPYFTAAWPKSLDRYDFSLDAVAALSLEDACATLTAFAAQAVAMGLRAAVHPPLQLIICGGGRHNPVLLAQIQACVDIPVRTAEAVGWRGDAIEAEAFAYLAARRLKGLPISFPGTTGVPTPMTGGHLIEPQAQYLTRTAQAQAK